MSPSTLPKSTACPLDCYDACAIQFQDNKLKPSKDYITKGKLCKLFGYLQNEKNIKSDNLPDILNKVVSKLKEPNQKILYYKGSGNMGVMQHIPKKFFEAIKATFAVGSICESSGEAGIKMGRKYSVNPPIQQAIDADIVLVWGRNFKETSRHIYDLVKNKPIITIDPKETSIAKDSKVFLQIAPKGDYQLAKVLRLVLEEKKIDTDLLNSLNITESQVVETITLLKGKKIAVMLGLGAQKYVEGATIVHEMEKLFYKLGVFEESNGGVWYLANSTYPFNNKIAVTPTITTPYPNINFADYDIVFIQGANPVVSAPNTKEIIKGLINSFVIYMGTTSNDTSKYADIVIPSKTLLEKKDVRLSYAHDKVMSCELCEYSSQAINEYELTSYLMNAFGYEKLLSEDEYLNCFKKKVRNKPEIIFKSKITNNVELFKMDKNEYYLLTSKSKNTINSQFKYDEYAYVHPDLNLKDNQKIKLKSIIGEITIKVKNDDTLHSQCILIYAGNKDVNCLTPNIVSEYGNNACFQDIKLTFEII
jgi:anaerobic selenocysteine-containing dehydrogenase